MSSVRASIPSPAKQLAGFIAKYDPAIQKQARACLTAVRKRLPAANQLVYDNYQFLAIGFSATERASDSTACFARCPSASTGPSSIPTPW